MSAVLWRMQLAADCYLEERLNAESGNSLNLAIPRTHIVVQMSESLNTKNSHSLNKAHTNIVVTFPGSRIRGIMPLS